MSASVLAAGVAADNVICAVYFMVLFALASKIPPAAPAPTTADATYMESDYQGNLPVLQTATALATSFVICKAAAYLTKLSAIQGGTLPGITAIMVILATLLPRQIGSLGPAGDTVAFVLMQIFFAVLGASGSIWNVIKTVPGIFMFALIQVTTHLLVILGLGKLFQLDLKLLLLASNANIGGPTTACGMAKAKRLGILSGSWNSCRHFWGLNCNIPWHWFWGDGSETLVEIIISKIQITNMYNKLQVMMFKQFQGIT